MTRRLSDPQRLVELVADQMFREEMRSQNGRRRAARNGAGVREDPRAAAAEVGGDRPSPCDPPG